MDTVPNTGKPFKTSHVAQSQLPEPGGYALYQGIYNLEQACVNHVKGELCVWKRG